MTARVGVGDCRSSGRVRPWLLRQSSQRLPEAGLAGGDADATIGNPRPSFWFFGRPSIYDLWNDMREVRSKFEYNFDPLTEEARAAWEAKHPERARTPKAMKPKKSAGRKREKAAVS